MIFRPGARASWIVVSAAMLAALLWLDAYRGGPASLMSRCNLLLSKGKSSAADVLIVGSSRSGTALDPLAMQEMLDVGLAGASPDVERMALGRSPLRASHSLLENYLRERGSPQVVVLEIMFLTPRSLEQVARSGSPLAPERYLYRRDLNLMRFGQILRMPAIAMPYSEEEGLFNRWRFRLRGMLLRAGALAYEFARAPFSRWSLSACDEAAWTREPEWPQDFAFSFGSSAAQESPAVLVEQFRNRLALEADSRGLKSWQASIPRGQTYPYDFDAAYRRGEFALLESMITMTTKRHISVVLLPLPLYGFQIGDDDLRALESRLPPKARIIDLYGRAGVDLAKFWYDDGHVEVATAGRLTTALLAEQLIATGLLRSGGAAR